MSEKEARKVALECSQRLRHRGPDWSGLWQGTKAILSHERLCIVGLHSGAQPLFDSDRRIVLTVNGEIFNYRQLRQSLKYNHPVLSDSDCEVIIPLYKEHGEAFVSQLDGQFSFVLYDGEHYIAGRDPLGITSFYVGWGVDGSMWFASELKALQTHCAKITQFPPGCLYSSRQKEFRRWYNPHWLTESFSSPYSPLYTEEVVAKKVLREALTQAVERQLMSDVPFGVLLSGGLDSSLIASLASRLHRRRVNDSKPKVGGAAFSSSSSAGWWPLHSFSIGLPGAPDLKFARIVADFLGTVHHEFHFTIDEGLDAVSSLVRHLETFDVTTIRASTPMFLLSRKIKALGVKMVLSGEGADEAFGGYLYFHKAPSARAFHQENVKRLLGLHAADCLRADKSTMAWGLEARVPFLSNSVLDAAMEVDANLKLCTEKRMEKYILRAAFDVEEGEEPFLPAEILWRQKEQFSDGVGYSWIDRLKEAAESQVTDQQMATAGLRFPFSTPRTKEGYFYRVLFHQHFPQEACQFTVTEWIPNREWGCPEDPSGRAQTAHQARL